MMRKRFRRLTYLSYAFMAVITLGLFLLIAAARTDWLPHHWNPLKPLNINAPLTPISLFQLMLAEKDKLNCMAALRNSGINVQPRNDFTSDQNARCGVKAYVELSDLGKTKINNLSTSCPVALRTAMWNEHVVRPMARKYLDTDIAAITHLGSYSCRAMRTSRGNSSKMSQHATASAIDIAGFTFTNGKRISLVKNWDDPKYHGFLEAVRDGGCNWFNGTLSPDYNSLHADHFHFDMSLWRFCR